MTGMSSLPLKRATMEIPGRQFGYQTEASSRLGTIGEDVLALICPDWSAPSLILDARHGRVAHANLNCLKLLENQALARLADGRLVFRSGEVNRRFHRALGQIAEANTEFAVVVGHCERSMSWFSITIRSAHDFLRDLSQWRLADGSWPSHLVVVEFATTENFPHAATLTALAEAFSLSPAETEVLQYLACGWSVQEIANMRGVTLATMRQRMKNVLAKTNCHRQAELIHLVMSLCPMIQRTDSVARKQTGPQELAE